ncbi:glycoside hydrolase family 3 domain protein [Desulfovibrio ferrophilus]|uniref:Glycoside hydrolase family 3 domain protein n=1 Tax=Desulfovibrio ferrophilus TaxID=241368 RepID=A0A2Z6AVF9_9BACT|nr:glycoside hydrolase family 3 domain protein [Desulfovibrio ferrophilus]
MVLYSISGNVRSPRQIAKLTVDAQRHALATGQPGLFISIDQEGGPVARLRKGFAVPPSNMTAGASGDPALAGLAAHITAAQLKAVGVNMNFAPSVDVNSNPANPIIGVRSYSGQTLDVERFGAKAIETYLKAGVIPVAKHFPGHGDTGYDSHLQLPTIPHSRQRLETVELPPFKAAIRAGVPAIMTAHVEVPALEPASGRPATMSRRILTELLRNEWGFEGLIITDSMSMGAITERYGAAEAALNAFKAGADVLLFGADKGHTPQDFIPAWERLQNAVQSGEITMQRLNASVLRILKIKERFGVLSPTLPDPAVAGQFTGTPSQKAEALRIAKAGLTLLRNTESQLPLPTESSVLVLWPNAKTPFFRNIDRPEGLQFMALPKDPGPEHIALALQAATTFDTVVVLTSRARRNAGQGDLLTALGNSPLAGHTVMVSLDTPYDILAAPHVTAWLAAYSSVPASIIAITESLYGRFIPNGKVPVEIPVLRPE